VSGDDQDAFDVQNFIGEFARRHNILLHKDDPLFMQLTLIERILVRAVERVREAVFAAQNDIAAGAVEHREIARAMARQIIAGAGENVANAIHAAGADVTAQMKTAAARELAEARALARAARWSAALAIAAALFALGVAFVCWQLAVR
jgi:hypothetical protein